MQFLINTVGKRLRKLDTNTGRNKILSGVDHGCSQLRLKFEMFCE